MDISIPINGWTIALFIYLLFIAIYQINDWRKVNKEHNNLLNHIKQRCKDEKSPQLNYRTWTDNLIDTILQLEEISKNLFSNIAQLKLECEKHHSLLNKAIKAHEDNILWSQHEFEKHTAELQERYRRMTTTLQSNYERAAAEKKKQISKLAQECEVWKWEIGDVQAALEESINSFFAHVSDLKADQIHRELLSCIDYLINKPRPIRPETAVAFKEKLNKETKLYYRNWQEAKLKYEYLLDLYQITDEDLEEEESTEEESTEEDVTEQNFLTNEEYQRLSTAEKSDLALKRYNARAKSIKRIGYDYELYCGYWLKTEARCRKIIQFGEQEGKKDHGRDIIAFDEQTTYIVQCKRWQQDKVIHEKHIFQLFGSTVEYCIAHQIPVTEIGKTIKPLFLTTAKYSNDAEKFAKELNVTLRYLPQGIYPQIKCNISANGEKIYHLPFDQQYNTTIIEEMKGEFFEWSAKDAESKGFRRAMRHIIQ